MAGKTQLADVLRLPAEKLYAHEISALIAEVTVLLR